MKILIINPNSGPEMTRLIRETAKRYAKGEFEAVYGVGTGKARRYNPAYP